VNTDATTFTYVRPELSRPKQMAALCRSDLMFSQVQIITEGGETNLHSHRYLDGFWFVLSGNARFYTTDDAVLAELGPHQGILIPRGLPYWFRSYGTEPLEILQVESSAKLVASVAEFGDGRIDHRPARASMESDVNEFVDGHSG
jgi:mannose-6-phosphate isomerase-like protein (cupin superfamily)